MFLNSFSDELTKLAINVSRLDPETREKLTFRVGAHTAKDFARGAVRKVGLDPDKPEHKALLAAGAATPVAAMAVSGHRQRKRIRRLEKAMAERQAARQARHQAVGSKVRKVLSKVVRRGR